MRHEAGKPGFRGDPPVLWRCGSQILTQGYFYDAEDYAEDNVLAVIDPFKVGVEAFQKGANIYQVERGLKSYLLSVYTTPSQGFLGERKADGTVILHWWREGGSLHEIERAPSIVSFWGEGDRLLYALRRADGRYEVILYDLAGDRRWTLYAGEKTQGYVFLSKDAATALVTRLDLAGGKMDIYAGRDEEGFALKPVEALQGVRMGTLRVSPDGRYAAFFNGDELILTELPQSR
jgi:hypothetical protein